MASAPLPAKLTIITASSSPRVPHIPIDLTSVSLSVSLPVIPTPEPSGSVMVFTDHAPNSTSPFHQTPSVDYAVVVPGKIIIDLEGGGSQEFGPGEAIVQAGARHRWRNESGEWVRLLFVMVGAFGSEEKEEGG